MAEDKEVKDGKVFALMAYLGILCLIPLVVKKDNKFVLFHGKQGLVLLIGELAAGIIGIIPFVGWIVGFISIILFGTLSLLGIVQVLMGNYWKIPVVADLADKFNI
ncbi:MAG: hypothetical protein V1883_00610 [Candidatus Omnitrophota bacterium]